MMCEIKRLILDITQVAQIELFNYNRKQNITINGKGQSTQFST